MKTALWSFIFFICFFRISIFYQQANLSIILGMIAVPLLALKLSNRNSLKVNRSLGLAFVTTILLFVFSLVIDLSSGELTRNTTNTFTVRIISVLIMSIAPAAYIHMYYIKSNHERLVKVITVAFIAQAIFWIVSYLSADIKTLLYTITGNSNSVNLRPYNLHTRGFGLSSEINYTSPFMMALLSITLLRSKPMILTTIGMQTINSNMTIIIGIISLIMSKRIGKFAKISITTILVLAFGYLGSKVFPRLFDEFISGNGFRTLNILLSQHLTFLYDSYFSFIFGAAAYTFQGGHAVSSDIGWVIMMNYGGAYYSVSFAIVIFIIIWNSFSNSQDRLLWYSAALLLNTKGLLLGPNAFFLSLTFLFLKNLNDNKRVQLDRVSDRSAEIVLQHA